MESLGTYLKREREFRQIPLIEISEATRISSQNLNAIENDHFDELPGSAFVRGYLKAYSRYVGLDVADVLLRYEHYLTHGDAEYVPAEQEKPAKQAGSRWRTIWVVGVITALVALAAYFASR